MSNFDIGKHLGQEIHPFLRQFEADLVLYVGMIDRPFDVNLIKECRRRDGSKNVFVVPVTFGGDPHVAYRIGRCLHRNYQRVTVCAPGPCFSAGTLLSIAGHELVMTDLGLLGPLDIQIQKSDELFETISGLTVTEAMDTVRSEAWAMLEYTLLKLKFASVGQITLKTALETATALTVGAFQPLFAQIDPMRLGEDSRSTRIIAEYGNRLDQRANNLQRNALVQLVSGYPSHRFEIDREEAQAKLFRNVREPNEAERRLIEELEPYFGLHAEKQVVQRIPQPDLQQSEEEHHAPQDNTRLSPGAGRTDGSPDPGSPHRNTTEKGPLS